MPNERVVNVVDWRVSIAAITGIVILESIALCKGVDGLAFKTSLAILAGLAGFTLKDILIRFRRK